MNEVPVTSVVNGVRAIRVPDDTAEWVAVRADELHALQEQLETLGRFASSVRAALTACATGGIGEIEALETIQDALDTVPVAPYPASGPKEDA